MIDAIETGFGIEYNAENAEFALKLRESGLWFSARKSYAEAAELAALLDSGKGTKRSWEEFLELAKPIVGNYNKTWLRTEYNTAVRAARIASLWQDILLTRETYPNVEFIRTRSANPRELHLKYVGIVQPIESTFWDTHTPPLDYNCLCSIRKTRKKPTTIPENLPTPQRGLDNNPAKSGQLFSDDHPYMRESKRVESVLQQEFRQEIKRMGKWYTFQTKAGSKFLVHPGLDKKEAMDNIRMASILSDLGKKMQVLPTVPNTGKQPDFLMNGFNADLKSLKTATNISGAIQSKIKEAGKQQCATVIIEGAATYQEMVSGVMAAIQPGRAKTIETIMFYRDEQFYTITRAAAEKRNFSSLTKKATQ